MCLPQHALVYGEYKGIPKQGVREALGAGADVVLRLDVQGAASVRALLPACVTVFVRAESEAALQERLVSRATEPPEALALRCALARDEMTRLSEFDYAVVNERGRLDRAVDQLCAIIDAEKCRIGRPRLAL